MAALGGLGPPIAAARSLRVWVANVAHRDALSRPIVQIAKRAYNPLVKARDHAMSLEELSIIAQIGSSLVVVASLIFVGFQIKHAAVAIRASSSQGDSECYTDLAKSVIDNADFARIWQIGLADPKALKDDEWVRFVAYANSLFRLYESSRVQWLNGRLDSDQWWAVEHQVADFWQLPGLQAAWMARGHGFSSEFRRWFDNYRPESSTVPYVRD